MDEERWIILFSGVLIICIGIFIGLVLGKKVWSEKKDGGLLIQARNVFIADGSKAYFYDGILRCGGNREMKLVEFKNQGDIVFIDVERVDGIYEIAYQRGSSRKPGIIWTG